MYWHIVSLATIVGIRYNCNCWRSIKSYLSILIKSCLADTTLHSSILKRVRKFPAETTIKCIEITLAITDSHYITALAGISNTLCGPQLVLLLLQRTFFIFDVFSCGHNMKVNASLEIADI
jgi:hypothetical protein